MSDMAGQAARVAVERCGSSRDTINRKSLLISNRSLPGVAGPLTIHFSPTCLAGALREGGVTYHFLFPNSLCDNAGAAAPG